MLKTRENTCKMLEMVDQGLINKDDLIYDLINWMSEAEVTEFMERNDFIDDEYDDE